MSTLVTTTRAGTTRHEPGRVVTFGRDPASTVQLQSPVVSRHHGEAVWQEGQWTYRDTSSSLGSWCDGERVRSRDLAEPVRLVLGQGDQAEVVDLQVEQDSGLRPAGRITEPMEEGATLLAGDALALECAGRTYHLTPGVESVVGRAEDADITCTNPTVSRRHALLRHTGAAWELLDTHSARGTFVEGRRVTSVLLRGTTEIMLGDARAGERIITSTSGERPVPLPRRALRAVSRHRPVAAATAVGLVAVLAVGGWGAVRAVSGSSGPDLDLLARASVRVITDQGSGSGTVVDAERGLVLTNAHVAAPTAIGRGVRTRQLADELGPAPTTITLATSKGLDQPAVERFRAEVAAVDGYLDLAVLRITGDQAGGEVSAKDLASLVQLEVGAAGRVRSADPVWVVGYPGLADSDAATYTRGVVSGTVHDKRLEGAVSLFNSDARINPGNSGGLAANADGKLIAVPTLNKKAREDSLLAGLVPAELAAPLIAAARDKKKYTSPWVVAEAPGTVIDLKVSAAGGSPGIAQGCVEGGRAKGEVIGVQVTYSGLSDAPHQDLLVSVAKQTATGLVPVGFASTTDQWPQRLASSGCLTATMSIGAELGPGTYVVRVGIGGNHAPLGTLTYRLS